MSKTALLFSGQGSQYLGMAKELYDNFESAREVFAVADKALGYRLEDIVFSSDPTELNKTVHSQPAIMACSLCAFEALKEKGIAFDGVAGHSLGEYAAMAASGMLSYEDAFGLIKIRAEAMQKAAESSSGVMYAVIGPAPSEIEQACEKTEGYVVPVNYNSPVQTVIAGEEKAVEAACELIKQTSSAKRVKAVKLGVASAFHCAVMQPAADEFLAKTEGFSFAEPKCSFFSNVLGDELHDFGGMRELLAKHIVSPVRFTDELAVMQAQGYDRFIECGPGKVLTGLVKKTLDGVTAVNCENSETLEAAYSNAHGNKQEKTVIKRLDYITWDEYFMGIALLSAQRSKDSSTQVGACIVSDENKILTVGYNGMPTGCNDDDMPWAREGAKLDTKYPFVCHAELNAILNSGASLKGGRLYVTLFPCNECAKAIIQSGIKEIVYLSDKYADTEETRASKLMLSMVGIKCRQYELSGREVKIGL